MAVAARTIAESEAEPQRRALPEFLSLLQTDTGGLAASEAARRLASFGPNEIRPEPFHPWRRLLARFWGPIPWMIEVAALLSAAVGHWTDFGIILALLLGNVAVGFWREFQAGNVVAALGARLAPEARVRRDGRWRTVPARELVPGDLVRLRLGDIVPADARLIGDEPVEVDRSTLTGESLPVARGEGEAVYSGSVVRRGEADGIVYATGERTYFGRTADLVRSERAASHLQRAIIKIADYLIALDLALVLVILLVALYRGDPLLQALEFALVLTVAAIPVAMPTVLSVTMAVGARRLAARQAVVKRLAAIEELAGVDVLCADKTGTLTMNRLTMGEPLPLGRHDATEVLRAAVLASREEDRDPIDLAVLAGAGAAASCEGCRVTRFVPFDPRSKRVEATVSGPDGRRFGVAKGAPQAILGLVADAAGVRAEVDRLVEDLAHRGYRALGVAGTGPDGSWRYLGLIPLSDPPRQDTAPTVQAARGLGIDVKMVTGDQIAIAREIADRVGLGDRIMAAKELEESRPHLAGRAAEAVEAADGFAQVFPEHKHHIVDLLQRAGHIVGMTGDGVNDAPALRRADVGIAVSGATEAARSAADIVLLAPGLAVITGAVRLSRRIFERMNGYAIYRISETIRVLLFMALSILAFDLYPVTAVMIVLLALLNDGAILSIASDRVPDSARPLTWRMGTVLGVATSLGLMGVVETFGLLYVIRRVLDLPLDVIRSILFLKLAVAGHLTYFVARTRGRFWSRRPAWLVLAAVLGTQTVSSVIVAEGVLMAPAGWTAVALVWLYCLVWFLIEDQVKLMALRIFDRRRPGLLLREEGTPTAGRSSARRDFRGRGLGALRRRERPVRRPVPDA